MGTGYYYFEADIEKGAENARIEIRKGSPDGLLMGTVLITSLPERQNNNLNKHIYDEKNNNCALTAHGSKCNCRSTKPTILWIRRIGLNVGRHGQR